MPPKICCNKSCRKRRVPVRDAAETQLRESAEHMAEDDGKARVGVETVIAAWVAGTPETLRADLPRQMERFGLDPAEYAHLLDSRD